MLHPGSLSVISDLHPHR